MARKQVEQSITEMPDATPEKQVADAQMEAEAAEIDTVLPKEAKAAAHEQVLVQVPKAFTLRIDNHAVVNMPAGVYKVDRFIASHWYSIANKIKVLD